MRRSRRTIQSLAQWAITKLSCQYLTDSSVPECQAHCPQGVWFSNGTVRPTYDLILRSW